MKRNIFVLLTVLNAGAAFLLYSCGNANKHKLVKKWETEMVFKSPESALFDKDNNILYVSNVDGEDTETPDGKGAISKMNSDGKKIEINWVSGLNSPKGLGLFSDKLYVADRTEIIIIDVESANVEKKIPVSGSEGLNDLTIDENGVIYVSDAKAKKVFRVKNEVTELILDSLKTPNGLLSFKGNLYMLESDALYKINPDKSLVKIADELKGGLDGVEIITGKDFIVTGWNGVVWYVYENGEKEKLLDTRSKNINAADIGIDTVTRTVFIPTYGRNTVVAYEVK
jgi:sugar lactone lactonase YvrE